MAANFRRTRYLVMVTLGTSLFLQVCPSASAQQSDQGAPQTAPSSQGAPVTAPAAQGAPQTAQTPKTAPVKKAPQATSKKAKKKSDAKPVPDASSEPDKVLYDRALVDLKAAPLHGRPPGLANPDQHLSG